MLSGELAVHCSTLVDLPRQKCPAFRRRPIICSTVCFLEERLRSRLLRGPIKYCSHRSVSPNGRAIFSSKCSAGDK